MSVDTTSDEQTSGRATAPIAQATTAPSPSEAPVAPPPRVIEACPLCGAPLNPEQDWCLACGAAARTRLAATPNWRAPIATVAVVAALALGVLAAALVKLAGGSGSSSATVPATTTVTAAPGVTAAPNTKQTTATTSGAGLVPGATATATLPGAATTAPGAAGSTTVTTTPGGTSATTITPAQREAQRQAGSPFATK